MQDAAATEELALRAASGDPAALDLLLQGIRPEVVRRCGRFLPCREDAEEAAQDVLLQVARKITSFEGRSRFSTWLYTVVANCARQKYRELKRRAAEQPDAIDASQHVDHERDRRIPHRPRSAGAPGARTPASGGAVGLPGHLPAGVRRGRRARRHSARHARPAARGAQAGQALAGRRVLTDRRPPAAVDHRASRQPANPKSVVAPGVRG